MGTCSAKQSLIIGNGLIRLEQDIANKNWPDIATTLAQVYLDYENMAPADQKKATTIIGNLSRAQNNTSTERLEPPQYDK